MSITPKSRKDHTNKHNTLKGVKGHHLDIDHKKELRYQTQLSLFYFFESAYFRIALT
jgi:hypothetical protein